VTVTAALLATIALRTAIVLVALFGGMRLLGKRAIGELNLFDLLLILMVANAVQNSMTEGIGPLAVALTAGTTLLLTGWAVAELVARRPALERRAMGAPAVLVHHGRLNSRALRREHLAPDEVMAAVREQGLAQLAEVRLAVLEIDGTISVVPEEGASAR
jgi:uncharacterized membrane protein YcaP (DUF421 family)